MSLFTDNRTFVVDNLDMPQDRAFMYSMAPTEQRLCTQTVTIWLGGSWTDWAKLWGNIGVAHTAAVFMKEINYDAKSGTITNASSIVSSYCA
jgi:hypothetical protein